VAQYLLFKFYYCLDTRDYEGAAALFPPDGVWVRQGEHLVGPAPILAAFAVRSATLVIHHVITNLFVESVDADFASVTSYITAYRHESGAPIEGPAPLTGPALVGFCRAEISREPQGWRISRLATGTPTFRASPAA
jgi:hypothetical protein